MTPPCPRLPPFRLRLRAEAKARGQQGPSLAAFFQESGRYLPHWPRVRKRPLRSFAGCVSATTARGSRLHEMPPRGRKPTPRPHQADGKRPPLPRTLFPEAKTAWRQIIADLEQAGSLSSSDGLVIELAAVAVGRVRQARSQLAREGLQVRSERGAIVHPLARLELAMMSQARQLLAELGASPTARARLRIDSGIDPLAPFADLGPSPRVVALRSAD